MNEFETSFKLPKPSWYELAATDTDVKPSADGVNVAVYTEGGELVEAKLDKVPPLTVMSPTTKSVVGSLDVNVSTIEASFVVEPDVTVDVIVIVGSTPSIA